MPQVIVLILPYSFRQEDLRSFGSVAFFVLVVEEKVDNGLAFFDMCESSHLRVEEPHAKPDLVFIAPRIVPNETVQAQELIVGQLGTLEVSHDTQGIHDDWSELHLRWSQHLGVVDADLDRHFEFFKVLLVETELLVFFFFLHSVVLE